ncbi:hypothetical protein ACFVAV_35345 [Nocardia sp. NPDC057663]|uniref:hypothetical protein n=1 Tax=Nocardia sp. NPDC057663 TaxID=3346201 RepID=UPI00366FB144
MPGLAREWPINLPDIADVAVGLHRGPLEPALRQDRTAVRTRERYTQIHGCWPRA